MFMNKILVECLRKIGVPPILFYIVGEAFCLPPPHVVILEQGVFSRDSSLRSRMTARENAAAKDLVGR